MAKISTLLDRIHDEYPAVPEALALRALSDATKEFCSRTLAWQESLPGINLRPGRTTYELEFDPGLQLVALTDVRLDGRKIYAVPVERFRLRGTDPHPGEPDGYAQWQPGILELDRAPVNAGRLEVKAALTVKLGATDVELPDALVDEYGEALASGAKSRLVRQAGQPWFLPDLVVAYAGPFYSAMNDAKRRVRFSLGESQTQVEMRTW